MRYLDEFRAYWRPLAAATLGLATGTAINQTTGSIFAPALIKDFGWARADFALKDLLTLHLMIVIPMIGVLVDLLGVKRIATIGIVSLPLTYLACAAMTGSIQLYFLLFFLQVTLGATTTAMVYARIVALRFTSARGVALAIVACGGALLFAFSGPLIGHIIDTYGWRIAYQVLAGFSAFTGLITWLLLPNDKAQPVSEAAQPDASPRPSRLAPYLSVFRTPVFWVIGMAMWLSYTPHTVVGSQFKLILLEKGLSSSGANWLISGFTIMVVTGRFVCGISLDRSPTWVVAMVGMMLPALGLFVLASPLESKEVVVAAAIIMGLAQGVEIDLLTYLVARYFKRDVYGTAIGMVYGGMILFSALSSYLLRQTLLLTDRYSLFMTITGILTLVGASLFFLLRKAQAADDPEVAAHE